MELLALYFYEKIKNEIKSQMIDITFEYRQ